MPTWWPSCVNKTSRSPMSARKPERSTSASGTGVKPRDIVIFTRQFATMIDAGLPLVQALDILANQSDNKTFRQDPRGCQGPRRGRRVLLRRPAQPPQGLRRAVRQPDRRRRGRRYPRHDHDPAGDLHRKVDEAAHQGQGRDGLPDRRGDHRRRRDHHLLWKVIPVFENMFTDMGAGALPALTQFVIDMSRGFVDNIATHLRRD